MARAPSPMSAPPAGAAGGMMAPDPSAAGGMGGDTDAAGSDMDSDADDNVVVTICSDGQGGYTVYAGDEPESGAGDADMSEDDANAMGGAGAGPAGGGGMGGGGMGGGGMGSGGIGASQGQPADSIGAALKIALTILTDAKSSEGAPGNADDQFESGFGASKSPTPATGPSQKY